MRRDLKDRNVLICRKCTFSCDRPENIKYCRYCYGAYLRKNMTRLQGIGHSKGYGVAEYACNNCMPETESEEDDSIDYNTNSTSSKNKTIYLGNVNDYFFPEKGTECSKCGFIARIECNGCGEYRLCTFCRYTLELCPICKA
jgi:hypothetical protein